MSIITQGLFNLFPFGVQVDTGLKVLQAGHLLLRIVPELKVGQDFRPLMEIIKPIPLKTNELVLIAFQKHASLHLRGQVIILPDKTLFFAMNLKVSHVNQLLNVGLSLEDFSPSDGTPDFLLAMQTYEMGLEDAIEMNEKLTLQKKELTKQGLYLNVQHDVDKVLFDDKGDKETLEKIIELLCGSLKFNVGLIWMKDEAKNALLLESRWVNDSTFLDQIILFDVVEYEKGSGLAGFVWETGRAYWVQNLEEDPINAMSSESLPEGIKSGVVLPIKIDGETIGVLQLLSIENLEEDIQLIRTTEGIATRIGGYITKKKTQKLLQEQQIKTLAASKMSALGQMASGIAHEVNNPLSIIYSYVIDIKTQLNEETVDKEAVGKYVDKISAMVERITKTVKALSTFARSGQSEDFTLNIMGNIIDETVELCQEKIRMFGIGLSVSLPDKDIYVECNAVQISEVILNLINNACDAIENLEHRWIHIEVAQQADHVEVTITDSGLGIPEEVRKKIMQPFFTTKAAGKGTGLGLSISKGIIEAHHGQFMINEDYPHTQFILNLPNRQPGSSRK